MRWLVFAVVLCLGACASRASYTSTHRVTGTCSGACEHYLDCKGSDDQRIYRACMAECPFADAESAAEFERLSCDAAVSFVEGDSGRAPGEPARSKTEASR